MKNKDVFGSESWYNHKGMDDDVVVSSRVRLARNLANFPFPVNFHDDDAERIQNIVLDSFNHFPDVDAWQMVPFSSLEPLGEKILMERKLFQEKNGTGLVTRLDGVVSCLVNCKDHVRISSFYPGLACDKAYSTSRDVDENLQKHIQFAASHDFGFLTSRVKDAGSGMKTSVVLHLPSISYSGKLKELYEELKPKGFTIRDCYGAGERSASSLGSFYQISNASSAKGSEIDQLASITAETKLICEMERKIRDELADNRRTVLCDLVVRSFAVTRYCSLMGLREAIDVISTLKWGLDLGFIEGPEDYDFSSLLYRVQSGHLEFLLKTSNFKFEEDILEDQNLKEQRLRAIVLQKILENMKLVS